MPSIFDAYDYVGYIVPGGMLMFGIAYLFPWIREEFGSSAFGSAGTQIGGLGSLVILAFVLGQLLHQVGHLIRDDLRVRSIDVVACGDERVLSSPEREQLLTAIRSEFAELKSQDLCAPASRSAWRDVVRRIDVKLRRVNMNERIDILFRSTDLNMALTIAFVVLIVIAALCLMLKEIAYIPGLRFALSWRDRDDRIKAVSALIGLFVVAVIVFYRMKYFDDLYARQLFVTYLSQGPTKP